MNDPKSYDGLSSLVFFLGAYEGAVPFLAKWLGMTPLLSLPSRLPGPAWWIVSVAALVIAFLLLWWIDVAKKRRFPTS
ncbi:hypothetical protein [Actinomadura roseirufa]|uniref:hypothetical protein n=1 Tax=Actinomadura roseirufa TaxID=2094049 RepID=UPI001041536C|nr:hypothetical protein [Actinomadura roseirufa]